MPLYPLVVAPFIANGLAYPWLIVFKALVGATLPWLAYRIGSMLFNPSIGLLAAVGTALNPYAVVHGPSLQDTVIFNWLLALSVYLVIRAHREQTLAQSAAAGLALALATLTTARMALFVPIALVWLVSDRRSSSRALRIAVAALPIVLLLGGWMARNATWVGSPVLTTESGLSLWMANNDVTAAYLPARSIDSLRPAAWSRLTEVQRRTALSLDRDEVALDRFYAGLAFAHVTGDPAGSLALAARKIAYSFIGYLSPARSWPIQFAHAMIFLPINVMAIVGLWRMRAAGGAHLLVQLMFLSFVVTTGIFWAHTSHRSFLHVFQFIYAASVVKVRTGAYGG
jgi:hypothetical protein